MRNNNIKNQKLCLPAGRSKNIFILTVLFPLLIGIGFLIGFLTGDKSASCKNNPIKPLRADGYQFTSPLLTCDTEQDPVSEESKTLERKLTDYINKEIANGNIISASVFVRDYDGGFITNVFPEQRYYPASLGKIPVMFSVFKTVATNPNFLNEQFLYDDTVDYNANVEIKPAQFLVSGNKYSINDALTKMIVYSDNNALIFLSKHIDQKIYDSSFQELKVPISPDANQINDFMTAKEFSYFLRVLYNATFLSRENSEKSLQMLIQAEYQKSLAAGLPDSAKIAHKFGLLSNIEDGKTVSRELHDCGVVYPENDYPYLICAMTKGNSTLENQENVLKNISETTFEALRN